MQVCITIKHWHALPITSSIGQVLILLAVLAPLAFHFIPYKHLPAISLLNFHPATESENENWRPHAGQKLQHRVYES